MDFPECLTCPHVGNTFAGVPISQTWNDLALWEEFLDRYSPASIVELGTWRGGMALFLALQCRQRGGSFATIDNVDLLEGWKTLLTDLGAEIYHWDLMSGETPGLLEALLARLPKPTVLFCDNGNKPREFETFVPLLLPGDFVAVHDWNTEFRLENIKPEIPMLLEKECLSRESMTRFFQVEIPN